MTTDVNNALDGGAPYTPHKDSAIVEVRRPALARWALLAAIAALTSIFLTLWWRDGAVIMGVLAIPTGLVGVAVYRAKGMVVRFDGEAVFDDTGLVLCRIDDIEKVERGIAPLNPSSGFVIRTHKSQPSGWSPGLWWRFGRRIGIGGATSARAGRNMASAIDLVRSGVLDEMTTRED
jgi:hypothetical protein